MKDLKKEKALAIAKEKGRPNTAVNQELSDKLKLEREQREMYISKMKEQLNIVSSSQYGLALQQLETNIDYEKTKLEKFEFQLIEIHKQFKVCFNDQAKSLIMSHGDKF